MTLFRMLALLFLLFAALPLRAATILFHGGGGDGPLLQQGAPLIDGGAGGAEVTGASLFAGRSGGSLFEPVTRVSRIGQAPLPGPYASKADRIRHIIARAEAGAAGYDAVQHGARIRPRKRPTQLTIGEIYDWIARTPGQPHAIGRYQFIPSTLRRLVARAGLSRGTRFSPPVQDRLADLLLLDAGFDRLERGEISRTQFMNNLAKIWAGLPTSSGRSHYHGYAGNKATMTWARFEREMAPIFPR